MLKQAKTTFHSVHEICIVVHVTLVMGELANVALLI